MKQSDRCFLKVEPMERIARKKGNGRKFIYISIPFPNALSFLKKKKKRKGDRRRLRQYLGQFFLDSTGGFALKKRTRVVSAKQTDPPRRSVYIDFIAVLIGLKSRRNN